MLISGCLSIGPYRRPNAATKCQTGTGPVPQSRFCDAAKKSRPLRERSHALSRSERRHWCPSVDVIGAHYSATSGSGPSGSTESHGRSAARRYFCLSTERYAPRSAYLAAHLAIGHYVGSSIQQNPERESSIDSDCACRGLSFTGRNSCELRVHFGNAIRALRRHHDRFLHDQGILLE